MDAYNHMRTPFFKLVSNVADAPFQKKFSRLGPDLVNRPIEIFHPVLLVLEHPVVNINQFIGYVMRFLDPFDDLYDRRITLPKLIKPVRDRLRRRPMPATRI